MVTPRWSRAHDLAVPSGILGCIVVADALLPADVVVSGAFAIAAVVASALVTVRQTALVAAAALLLAALSALWNQNLGR